MKMLSALFLLILQTNLLLFSVESICFNDNGNYTVNSTYANNLDTALSSIPTNIDIRIFYNASAGSRAPDIAYATALCRGDVLPDVCRGCIQNLIARLRTECPNQKQAVGWEDLCWLRYSNQTLLGIMATSPAVLLQSVQDVPNPDEFFGELRRHLVNLRRRAVNGGPRMKMAAGNVTANDFQTIFALVQCTPDLSSDDCNRCLIAAAADIPACCDRKRGGIVLYPSCCNRFETYPFMNETRLREIDPVLQSPAPQPPLAPVTPLPPPSPGTNNTTRTIIIVVVSTVAFLILSVLVFIWVRKKINIQTSEESHETVSTVESLKYTLTTIRTATNDFSDDNKLGQGGFGVVYKGKLSNNQEIAVKRLSQNSGQALQEMNTTGTTFVVPIACLVVAICVLERQVVPTRSLL